MKFRPFVYDGSDISLDRAEILLHKEFEALWNSDKNKTKEDKDGKAKTWAYRVFKYIYLSEDFTCDYQELAETDREEYAAEDSGLSKEELWLPEVRAAKIKYRDLQDTRLLKLLNSSYLVIDKLRIFFETLNLDEEDDNGKLKISSRDVISNLSNLGKLVEGIQTLEDQVKREREVNKGIRGDATPGYNN